MDNDGADPSSADSGARSATRMMFGGGATPTPEPGASASLQSVPDPERAAPEESLLNETRVSVEPAPSTHQQTTPSGDYDRTNSAFRGTGVVGGDQLRAPADDGPRVKLQVGKMVPGTRYKIESWLGEGGMGVVYLAEHQDIGRKVALKILRLDLSQLFEGARVGQHTDVFSGHRLLLRESDPLDVFGPVDWRLVAPLGYDRLYR